MRVAICTLREDLLSLTGPGLATVRQAAALKELGAEVMLLAASPAGTISARPFEVCGVSGMALAGPICPNRRAMEAMALAAPRYLAEWHDMAIGRLVRRELDRFQPEALVVHGMTPWAVTGLRISAARSIPLAVVERSNLVARRMRAASGLGKFYNTCARGTRAIFVADRLVRQRLGQDLALENLVTLRDAGATAPAGSRDQLRPDRWFGRRLVVAPGVGEPGDGGEAHLEAFARANLPHASMLLIGGRADRARALAERLGVVDRVECLPDPGLDTLARLLAWADLFVTPGWSEGAGALTAEAMGAGVPVIMAGDTPLAVDIEEGVQGWTFPAGDVGGLAERLRHAFAAPNVEAVGKAGRAMIEERFPWSRNAQRLLYELGLLRAGALAAA
jgi:glycosyltransferase involved in cell wall biosynthesis